LTPTRMRRANVAAGALIMGTGALMAGPASAQAAVQAKVNSTHVRLGQDVVVSGTADTGHTVQLQYEPARQRSWQTVASTTVGGNGRFRLTAALRQSGLVQVVDPSGSSTATAAAANGPQRVSVTSSVRVRPRAVNVLGGKWIHVRGRLLPAVSGRKVRLEARGSHGWRDVATGRTGGQGRFNLAFYAGSLGSTPLRVRFAGDDLNGWSGSSAGRVTVYRQSLASWYNDGGTTGCGFHAYYGVANKSLPCGAQVTFAVGGRTVTATVDDRGPYAGGREWDLNQNTAAALGFAGVGTVWSSR
jgi:peptidoglycan lytic transglycosylase